MKSQIDITSEIGTLRKVLIHAPGPEWDLVPCGPKVLERFLIEDIFVLSEARKQHGRLTEVLELFIGKDNVLEFEGLLASVCGDARTRQEVVGAVTALDSLGLDLSRALLNDVQISPQQLARALICGATCAFRTGQDTLPDDSHRRSYLNLFKPSPNLLFTRDVGAAIPGGFIICHAAMQARRRETLLMRYVLRHELFSGATIIDIRDLQRTMFWHDIGGGKPASIEGGDILVLDEKTLMIGTGERTTQAGLDFLLDLLKETQSPVRVVIRVKLPEDRTTMHLDTVFTVISRKEFMVHVPVVNISEFMIYRHPFEEENVSGPMDFATAMELARLDDIDVIQCGGENLLFQSREQWTDGANLLAIAPGILLGYERNEETRKALEARGYQYLGAAEDRDMSEIRRAADAFTNGDTSLRLVIGLPGSELSRARGGPRCMTMPLWRDPA